MKKTFKSYGTKNVSIF